MVSIVLNIDYICGVRLKNIHAVFGVLTIKRDQVKDGIGFNSSHDPDERPPISKAAYGAFPQAHSWKGAPCKRRWAKPIR